MLFSVFPSAKNGCFLLTKKASTATATETPPLPLILLLSLHPLRERQHPRIYYLHQCQKRRIFHAFSAFPSAKNGHFLPTKKASTATATETPPAS
jgi:hypothetical protein